MPILQRSSGPPAIPGLSLYARPLGELPPYLAAMAREHGGFVRFRGPLRSVYLVTRPALVEEVLVTQARAFHKGRGVERLRPLLGNGLLTAEQPEHLANRRLVQPAFHRTRLSDYGRIMVEATLARVATWRDRETIAINDESMAFTLDIVARALFGTDVSAYTRDIGEALEDVMATLAVTLGPFGALLNRLPLRSARRFRAARQRLDNVVARLVADARARGGDRGDVMSLLLLAGDGECPAMSDAQIRDEALTILLAGHETTSNAISWAFYLLARHPSVDDALRAHLARVLGERAPSADDLAQLDYVRAVVAETMRLYPPAWAIGRRAVEAVTLDGHRIARGDYVLTMPYVTHRDPTLFAEPERFRPERWLEGRTLPKFAYYPFGGGNRTCIGESFAWMESMLCIATIAQRVRLRRRDDAEVTLRPLITLRPATPIRATVERLDLVSETAARSA